MEIGGGRRLAARGPDLRGVAAQKEAPPPGDTACLFQSLLLISGAEFQPSRFRSGFSGGLGEMKVTQDRAWSNSGPGASGSQHRFPDSSAMATLSLLLLGALLWVPAGTLTCYGDSGQPVDWFVIYKLPANNSYKYLDADSGGWRDGAWSIDNLKGAVGRSLLPLYRNTSQLAFLLYNDQPPYNGTQNSSSRGHTKGVLLLDKDEGFWLIHSVPRFPPKATYRWPPKAHRYGQTLLCVSFPFDQFSKIGKQLSYTYPNVYASQLKGVFLKKLPALEEVVKGYHVLNRPWNSSVTLTSKAGATFQSFAKFGKFGDDLYSGWLAENLGSNLQVQFWQHSPGILPSNCSGAQQVLDVTQIAFPGPAGPTFSTTEDHSKWCVAPEGPWACVGDMNRNRGEEHRGGGTLCTQLPAFWKAFQPLVKAWKPCERRAAPCLQKAQQSI